MSGRTETNRSAAIVAAGMGTAVLLLAALPPGQARSAIAEDDITIAGNVEASSPTASCSPRPRLTLTCPWT